MHGESLLNIWEYQEINTVDSLASYLKVVFVHSVISIGSFIKHFCKFRMTKLFTTVVDFDKIKYARNLGLN